MSAKAILKTSPKHHHLDQVLRLHLQAGGHSGHLFHQGRILLRYLVIWVTASPIWLTPSDCSLLVALISPIRSVTRLMLVTTLVWMPILVWCTALRVLLPTSMT